VDRVLAPYRGISPSPTWATGIPPGSRAIRPGRRSSSLVPEVATGALTVEIHLLDPEPPGERFAENQALLVLSQLAAVLDQSAVPVGGASVAQPGEHRLPER
jgi:hypothetical protein